MTVFLDTNIALYAFSSDELRQPKAMRLLEDGFEISVQVLNEFANVSRRKLRKEWPEIEAGLGFLRATAKMIYPVTLDANSLGIEISSRYRLSVYDAVLIASAILADCDTFYSEDMQHGMVIEGLLTIRNPFA